MTAWWKATLLQLQGLIDDGFVEEQRTAGAPGPWSRPGDAGAGGLQQGEAPAAEAGGHVDSGAFLDGFESDWDAGESDDSFEYDHQTGSGPPKQPTLHAGGVHHEGGRGQDLGREGEAGSGEHLQDGGRVTKDGGIYGSSIGAAEDDEGPQS